jgi:hypothetical protein
MLLDFEEIHTNFSWGRNNITIENMDLIGAASLRHGFQALGLQPISLQAVGLQAISLQQVGLQASLAANQPALPS